MRDEINTKLNFQLFIDMHKEGVYTPNQYAAEEHEQFRDAIVRQLMVQMQGIDAELTGDRRAAILPDPSDQLFRF